MKIDFNSGVNFQASFVNRCTVGKYLKEKSCYENTDVYFVKLNPSDKNDVNALDKIANNWIDDIFSVNIYNNANDIYKKNQKSDDMYTPIRDFFYALTTQKDNLENLDYKKVLGICDGRLFTARNIYLSHIQINPEYTYLSQFGLNFAPFKYKGLGSAMINSLKNLYSQIELSSRNNEAVRNFYLKNGFTNKPCSKTKFIWTRYA